MASVAAYLCLTTLLAGVFAFPSATLAGTAAELQQLEAQMRDMKVRNDQAHAAYRQNQAELSKKRAERNRVAGEINRPTPEEKYWRNLADNPNLVFVYYPDLSSSISDWDSKSAPYGHELNTHFYPITRQAWKEHLKATKHYSQPNVEYMAKQNLAIKLRIKNVVLPKVKQKQAQDILERTKQMDAEILQLEQAGKKLKADHAKLHQEYNQLKKRRQALKTALKPRPRPRPPHLTQPPRAPATPHPSGDKGPGTVTPPSTTPGPAKGFRKEVDIGGPFTPPKNR